MSRVRLPALVVLAVLLAATTCVSTANAQAAWVWYAESGHFGRVAQQSVSMVSATDGWIVGSSGTILRCHEGGWTGGWSPLGATTGPSLNSVYALNVNDAWAVGSGGTTLHWDGTSWTVQTTSIPSSVDLYSVFMVSTSEVWAVGNNAKIFYFNGHGWAPWALANCPVGGCPNEALHSVYMVSSADGWAVGSHGTILHFDGSWVPYTTTHPTDSLLLSVYMVNSGDGWAVGTGGTILHYDGTSWTAGSVLTYGGNPVTLYSVFMWGSTGWAVGNDGTRGIVAHYASFGSSVVPLWYAYGAPTGTGPGYGTGLYSVFILPSGTEGWAVGDEGMMLHYSLRSAPAPPTVVTLPATDVTATSALLHGTVNPNGRDTLWQFTVTDPFGAVTNCPLASSLQSADSIAHDVICQVNTLTASTTYSYTMSASNDVGFSPPGLSILFTTSGAGTPGFSFVCVPSAPSSVTLMQGGSGQSICTVASQNGFNSPVTLSGSWSGMTPTGVTPTLSAPSITPPPNGARRVTLAFTADPTALTGGPFTYRVTGTSGTLVQSVDVPVSVNVNPWTAIGDKPTAYTLAPATDITDTSAVLHGRVNPNGLAVSAWDFANPSATMIYCPVNPGGTLAASTTMQDVSCTADNLTPETTYEFMIRATSSAGTSLGSVLEFTTLPAPTGGAVPTAYTLAPATDITDTSAVLYGNVNPNGLQTTWDFVSPSQTTVYCPSSPDTSLPVDNVAHEVHCTAPNLTPGTPYQFRIRATNSAGTSLGSILEFTTASAGPGEAGFSISVNPASLSLGASASGTSTITVQSLGSFSTPVSLTATGSGFNFAWSLNPVPAPVAGGQSSATLTVTVAGAAAGTQTITITGTSTTDPTIHSETTLTVIVAGGGGGCLIATATYGSELSPEVQFLRGFRDNSIFKTSAGSSFMVAFNAWYYSFSPYVADFIRGNSFARAVTRLVLYPLMGILRVGASVFYALPGSLEVGAVVSGLLVSSLIGIVYLSPPLAVASACSRRVRRIAKRIELPVVGVMLGAVVGVAFIAAVNAPSIFMMLSTAAVVLATLAASAVYTSRALLHILHSAERVS